MAEFKPGDKVVYTQMCHELGYPPRLTEWPAAYIRSQITSGRRMHVIKISADTGPLHPIQVGNDSIRAA